MHKKIIASNGHILTNGEIYGIELYLGEGIESNDFYEITIEEYNQKMEEELNSTLLF